MRVKLPCIAHYHHLHRKDSAVNPPPSFLDRIKSVIGHSRGGLSASMILLVSAQDRRILAVQSFPVFNNLSPHPQSAPHPGDLVPPSVFAPAIRAKRPLAHAWFCVVALWALVQWSWSRHVRPRSDRVASCECISLAGEE